MTKGGETGKLSSEHLTEQHKCLDMIFEQQYMNVRQGS